MSFIIIYERQKSTIKIKKPGIIRKLIIPGIYFTHPTGGSIFFYYSETTSKGISTETSLCSLRIAL